MIVKQIQILKNSFLYIKIETIPLFFYNCRYKRYYDVIRKNARAENREKCPISPKMLHNQLDPQIAQLNNSKPLQFLGLL